MTQNREWLEREVKLLKTRRKYLHFDRKVNPYKVIHLISNPSFINSHSFWPFIESTISFPRYKKDTNSGRREIEIKNRKICYASHLDSEIYSYYNHILSAKYEEKLVNKNLNDSILAYRRLGNKCNIHFAKEVFSKIKNYDEVVVLTFDIEKFFDTLDHQIILSNLKTILSAEYLPADWYKIYRSLTKFSSVKREELNKVFDFKNLLKQKSTRICTSKKFRELIRGNGLILQNPDTRGIPQGSPMSGLISNVYMFNFDQVIINKISKLNGLYRRYSDDLIILIPPKFSDEIENLVYSLMDEITKLKIHPSKTNRVIFKRNALGRLECNSFDGKNSRLQYLGFEFDGNQILIRSSSVSRFYRKMSRRVKKINFQKNRSKSDKTKVFRKKLFSL